MADAVNHLAKTLPNITFIFRPHPFEGDEFYRRRMLRLPNLHVVKKGTVDGWLLRARAMIHWCSSTALEAGAAGIPVLTPGWLPFHLPTPALDAVSVRCSDLNELTQTIGAVVDDTYHVPSEVAQALKQSIEGTFYRCDGRSHERVAEAILECLAVREKRGLTDRLHYLLYGFGLPGGYFWRHRLKTMVRKAKDTHFTPWTKSEKHFDAALVENYLSRINARRSPSDRAVKAYPANKLRAYSPRWLGGMSVGVSGQWENSN